MADLIEKAHGEAVDLESGNRGEFTVWVGEKCVARKSVLGFPREHKAVRRVGKALARQAAASSPA